MPPPNDQRRAQLADAALELLVDEGVHGVTHRSVERRAALPAGTASNYFRSREALLLAVVRRVVAQHQADMNTARVADPDAPWQEQAIDLITESLILAATVHRRRYLAIFELRLEGLRRPALAAEIDAMMEGTAVFTAEHHAAHRLPIPPAAVPIMMIMYGGALFALVTGPPEAATPQFVRPLAEALVRGALHTAP
ncbi:TetR/AcrR family transcriptional regulator [Planosporangium sp. 12N6]|uniref:TetR/AcrR family transcriptional regulator n=1 Tax=Planosporangium spinosum TaxID=3402278 RepID=UPI003CEBD0E7